MTTLEIIGIVADIITIGASVVIIAVCVDILKTVKK